MPTYRHALLPGSYDPPTVGHLDVIRRACSLSERVTVGVFVNPDKTCLFSPLERVTLLRLACASMPQVTVICDEGMVYRYAREHGCDIIIKGYRDQDDFSYEYRMARFNADHALVETRLLEADPTLANVRSTEVRRRLEAGEPIDELVPPAVADEIARLLRAKKPLP